MANWLTHKVNEFLSPQETVLDLCCGDGHVSDGFVYSEITGVDICKEYLDRYLQKIQNSKIIVHDLSKISSSKDENFLPNTHDNVLCIDGIEHLEFDEGVQLLEKMEEISRKRVVIFTPENVLNPSEPTLNTPTNTWGITSGDQWQVHKSAFPRTFFQERGYSVYQLNTARNVYDNTFYYEMLYVKETK